MTKILVVGHINLETTLRVERFPLVYEPVRFPFFGVRTTVSGVGYNLAKALTTLGHAVRFVSVIGRDAVGDWVLESLRADGVDGRAIRRAVAETAQSVILYDADGRRQIHADLKDVQDQRLPEDVAAAALRDCELALLCNINYARPLLAQAQALGRPIVTDVHTIADLDDPYNADYMAAATVLFQSHERLPCPPQEWAARVQARYGTPVVVVGMGADGALLAVRGEPLRHAPAVRVRPIVSTIGAGDALLAAFVHGYAQSGDPWRALQQAVWFAGYKIGAAGAAEGLLDAAGLEALWAQRALTSADSGNALPGG